MRIIRVYPANKNHFLRLKKFGQKIQDFLNELGINPVLWGSLAYFGYTKDKKIIVNDIDFLVPRNSLKKIMSNLKKKKIKFKYLSKWYSLIIIKGKLKVELDPIEIYFKGKKSFELFDFDGFQINVAKLNHLISMYKHASQVSHDKPGKHRKKYEVLRRLK